MNENAERPEVLSRTRLVARAALEVLLAILVMGVAPVQAQTEVVEYYATDTLGSIRVVFDPSGNVKARSDYQPFGETWQPSGNLPTQRFTGQQRDIDEGLDYFHARSYLPRTGRFNASDPVFAGTFNPQAWNRYAYALNNPLLYTDPTGLQAESCSGTRVFTQDEEGNWRVIYSRSRECEEIGGGTRLLLLLLSYRNLFWSTAMAPEEDYYHGRGRRTSPPDLLTPPPGSEKDEAIDTTEAIIDGVTTVLSLGGKPAVKSAGKQVFRAITQRTLKPANLPSWRKVGINMTHVLERHKVGGPFTAGKSTFPYNMSERGIQAAIREAYRNGSRIGGSGDDFKIRGTAYGLTIEMWFNRATGVIETAFPVKP